MTTVYTSPAQKFFPPNFPNGAMTALFVNTNNNKGKRLEEMSKDFSSSLANLFVPTKRNFQEISFLLSNLLQRFGRKKFFHIFSEHLKMEKKKECLKLLLLEVILIVV
jgi:hypothetical protein